jgi:hypothetical protein
MSEYLEKILADAEQLHGSWDQLFAPPFKVQEVLTLISVLVRTAEDLIPDPGTGQQKSALVMEAWKYLDGKYHLIDRLDEAIKLPFFLEPFDGMVLRTGMESVVIPLVVTMANLLGWGKR